LLPTLALLALAGSGGAARAQPEEPTAWRDAVTVPIPIRLPDDLRPAVEARPDGPRPDGPPAPGRQPHQPDIQLEPPSFDQLFRPESEATLRERMRAEAKRQGWVAQFPGAPAEPPAPAAAVARPLPRQEATFLPSVVCHRPLYFRDCHGEGDGEGIPGLQPFLCTGKFYVDTLLLPYHLVRRPPWGWECEADGGAPPNGGASDAPPSPLGFLAGD
jgi:hypothetical protein